jgi:hypothetical protein
LFLFKKVFGILTQSGGILWKHYFPNFAPFEHLNTVQVPLFHIRSAAHYTHQPLASIVYRDRVKQKTNFFFIIDLIINILFRIHYIILIFKHLIHIQEI